MIETSRTVNKQTNKRQEKHFPTYSSSHWFFCDCLNLEMIEASGRVNEQQTNNNTDTHAHKRFQLAPLMLWSSLSSDAYSKQTKQTKQQNTQNTNIFQHTQAAPLVTVSNLQMRTVNKQTNINTKTKTLTHKYFQTYSSSSTGFRDRLRFQASRAVNKQANKQNNKTLKHTNISNILKQLHWLCDRLYLQMRTENKQTKQNKTNKQTFSNILKQLHWFCDRLRLQRILSRLWGVTHETAKLAKHAKGLLGSGKGRKAVKRIRGKWTRTKPRIPFPFQIPNVLFNLKTLAHLLVAWARKRRRVRH